MMRLLAIGTTAFLLAVLSAAVAVSPASAHDYCVHQGYDWGCVSNNHHTFSACDAETDGKRVTTEAFKDTGLGYTVVGAALTDPNGSGGTQGACGPESTQTVNFTIVGIRVCEEYPDGSGRLCAGYASSNQGG